MIRIKTINQKIRRFAAAVFVLTVFIFESVAAQGVLYVDGGEVGIGVANPVALLHAFSNNGSAQIRVEETSGTTAARSLYELYNNGPVGFNMFNTNSGETWRFAAQTTGFRVSLAGSGGPEVEFTDQGGMTVGPGAATVFTLTPAGNLTISGTLAQNSDVNAKRDIDAVDGAHVLTQLAQLPISEWAYKDDPGVRHVGPMAQDFYNTFELGSDNTKIAPGDMAGVSLAAIQALQAEIVSLKHEKDAEIAELKRTFSERIYALETALQATRADGSVGRVE